MLFRENTTLTTGVRGLGGQIGPCEAFDHFPFSKSNQIHEWQISHSGLFSSVLSKEMLDPADLLWDEQVVPLKLSQDWKVFHL